MKKEEIAALIENRFAIQAQSLELVYSRLIQKLEAILAEQRVLKSAIKELRNVNDGR